MQPHEVVDARQLDTAPDEHGLERLLRCEMRMEPGHSIRELVVRSDDLRCP